MHSDILKGMKIVIDGRMIGARWTGIGRYTRRLLEQLQKLDAENDYVVLLAERDFKEWRPMAKNFSARRADFEPYSFGEQIGLARLLYGLRPDLVHFPSFNLPLLYWGRYVMTLHDLTLVEFKNVRGGGFRRLIYELKYLSMRLDLWWVLKFGRAIIVPSRAVRALVLARWQIRPSKVVITYESAEVSPVKPGSIRHLVGDGRFLFYAGNAYPHKNLSRLVQAFSELQAKKPDLKLVLTGGGQGNSYFYDQLRELAKRLGIADKVVFAGFVSEAELAGLYREASLFVFPSLSEGFGLPGLEAMEYGTPVMAAGASCLPEIYGRAAAYFNPLDPADMAAKIALLLDDKDELERLRRAGYEQVKKYSWERMGRETLAVYRKALPGSR